VGIRGRGKEGKGKRERGKREKENKGKRKKGSEKKGVTLWGGIAAHVWSESGSESERRGGSEGVGVQGVQVHKRDEISRKYHKQVE
jgi:hypothetical protein